MIFVKGMGSPLKRRKADGSYRVMIERWERAQSSDFQASRTCPVSRNGACSVMDVTASSRLPLIGRAAATRFIVIGVVSLIADMTYEGARSISRPLAFAVILLGIGMAAQESVMRAVIASMTTPERRATARAKSTLTKVMGRSLPKRTHSWARRILRGRPPSFAWSCVRS